MMLPANTVQKNRLLAEMPEEIYDRSFSNLPVVSLFPKQVLYEVGDPLEYIYFVEQGIVSVLATMTNGSSVEVGMIGGGKASADCPSFSATTCRVNTLSCRLPAPPSACKPPTARPRSMRVPLFAPSCCATWERCSKSLHKPQRAINSTPSRSVALAGF